jgi:hypothetical protein
MTKEQDPNQWQREEFERMKKKLANIKSDKELDLFPTLQRMDSLREDMKLLIKKLEHVENDIKELKHEIL